VPYIFPLLMSLLTTYLVSRLIAWILRKNSVGPAYVATIAAALTFIVLTSPWIGTAYAAKAAGVYGASTAMWLTFDLYRLFTATGGSKSNSP
jgi:predicted membrane-bound spermidine synthase